MKRRKFSPEQKLKILQQAESEGMLATCRKHKIAQSYFIVGSISSIIRVLTAYRPPITG
jgi:transposase-like protein